MCPGPAIAAIGAGNWPVLLALLGMLAGAYVQGLLTRPRATVAALSD